MKREARRLKLARRQALLAEVSQRAAMLSLANALAEEARSETLASRSRDLVKIYEGKVAAQDAGSLAHKGQFAVAIGRLAHDAEQARADASQQALWQVEALGQAQTRARRQSEHLEQAQAVYVDARERLREEPQALRSPAGKRRLARNVQDDEQSKAPSPDHSSPDHSRTAP